MPRHRHIDLTKAERTRLVAILRIAVDSAIRHGALKSEGVVISITEAIIDLGLDVNNPIYDLAWNARDAVDEPSPWRLLEAAARVEEGSWP